MILFEVVISKVKFCFSTKFCFVILFDVFISKVFYGDDPFALKLNMYSFVLYSNRMYDYAVKYLFTNLKLNYMIYDRNKEKIVSKIRW